MIPRNNEPFFVLQILIMNIKDTCFERQQFTLPQK